jgi:hypothetical protein
MATVTHADGSHSFVFEDGVKFGPYGPGQCAAVHGSGMQCKHMHNHGGCHGTFDYNTPAGKMKHRWSDNKETSK